MADLPRLEYQEVPLADVVRSFANGFTAKQPGEKLRVTGWFLDPIKEVVVFKFMMEADRG